jgi:hypothetical protein
VSLRRRLERELVAASTRLTLQHGYRWLERHERLAPEVRAASPHVAFDRFRLLQHRREA